MKTFIAIICVLAVGTIPITPAIIVVKGPTVTTSSIPDWTVSSFLKGLYYMNSSPGINKDSTANANHIDDNVTVETPAANSSTKIEGDQSADPDNTGTDDGFILHYSNATADFPCNGTGDGEVTFAGWVRLESSPGSSEYCISINGGAQALRISATSNVVATFNGSSAVSVTSAATISTSTWYFLASVYSDTTDTIYLYKRAQGAGSSSWETGAASLGTLDDAGSTDFALGCVSDGTSVNCIDGTLDAWAVFNGKAFTQAELDSVFTNGWDGNGW